MARERGRSFPAAMDYLPWPGKRAYCTDWLRALHRAHPAYSECMYTLYLARRKAAEEGVVPAEVLFPADRTELRDRERAALRCLLVVKDYWRDVHAKLDACGVTTPREASLHAGRHLRFCELVPPFDHSQTRYDADLAGFAEPLDRDAIYQPHAAYAAEARDVRMKTYETAAAECVLGGPAVLPPVPGRDRATDDDSP